MNKPQALTPDDRGVAVHNRNPAWWTTALNGRLYRPAMRLMHRYGWCYPERTLIDERSVWCHWCGMRGGRLEG
jgi:hypothetical protein